MTMIELDDGSLVPLSAVEKLRPAPDREKYAVIGADGGRIGYARWESVQRCDSSLMPAAPGWRIGVVADHREPDFGIWLEPVIAWRIVVDNHPRPITLAGELEPDKYLTVSPDGYAMMGDSGAWQSLKEAETALREQWEKARAERAAA